MYSIYKNTISDTFLPMVERLRNERATFPRTILYCRHYEDCAELYMLFKNALAADFTEPPGSPDLATNVPPGRYVHELY